MLIDIYQNCLNDIEKNKELLTPQIINIKPEEVKNEEPIKNKAESSSLTFPIIDKSKTKKPISKILKNRVWNERIGECADGKCVACHGKVTKDSFECAHIQAEACGGLTIVSNLTVLCSTCNKSLGTKNLTEFMKKHGMV